MPRISKYCFIIVLILFLVGSAHAISSDIYCGFVCGPGSGLDLGAKVWLPIELNNNKLGLEIEEFITDYNYTAQICAFKGGLTVKRPVSPELSFSAHIGLFRLKSNKEVNLTDLSGNSQLLSANTSYKGLYGGVSIDYIMYIWDVILTPKLIVNNVDNKGSLLEFDLNIAKSF